ncbi:MAG: BrnA antitoxin family protein [Xanthomonadales bacterium]|nr:BrnA antitoxin family protein [Xanthomonadales bacterium]MCC6562626.1 BrnA antitoxin family protein [Xanthomonadales bacterium]
MSNATTGKTVRFTLDPANPPKLSEATIARLAAMKDEDIDFSDIPASPADAVWTRPGIPFSVENKRQITLRLDADVIDFFKQPGARYQTRINRVLRAFMDAHQPRNKAG